MGEFYYIDDSTKQQCGPFSIEELRSKGIQPQTLVWRSGMANWIEARTVSELAPLFGGQAPQPEAQQSSYSQYTQSSGTSAQQQYAQPQYNQPPYGQNQYNNGNAYNNNQAWNNQSGINDVRPMPKNWLVESILVTVLCCLPFGIAGIVSATKVESLYYSGDYEAAEQAAKDAKKWTIVGFCSVLVIGVIYFIFAIFMGMLSAF